MFLDAIGAIFSITATYYFTKVHPVAWVIAIIACLLNITLYFQTGIYGQGCLEFIFLFTSFYGLYQWTKNTNQNQELTITYLTKKQIIYLILFSIICILVVGLGLQYYVKSEIPFFDATVTVLSLIAQLLLCKKIIHTWHLWFIADALIIILHLQQGLPFHSFTFGVYLILAIIGYFRWRKIAPITTNKQFMVKITNG